MTTIITTTTTEIVDSYSNNTNNDLESGAAEEKGGGESSSSTRRVNKEENNNDTNDDDDIELQMKQSTKPSTSTATGSSSVVSCSSVDQQQQQQQQQQEKEEQEEQEKKIKKIGDKFSTDEFTFVLSAGILLAFNAGYVNGSCLSGLLMDSGIKQSVAGFTGSYTVSAMALGAGDYDIFGFQLTMILCFIIGCTITGFITPNPTPYRLEPTYGPTFFIGAIFLTTASLLVLACDDDHHGCTFQQSPFYFAAAANGIQNGISSLYSANLVRSTHLTGTSTDIGLFIGQILRGNRQHLWKLIVLISLATSFWLGGLISLFATQEFHQFSLLFNAGLYILIGIGFIIFIVHERHISILAAITGRWKWKSIFDQLEPTIIKSSSKQKSKQESKKLMKQRSEQLKSQHFGEFFDSLEGVDKNGELAVDDLMIELNKVPGVKLSKHDATVLMEHADIDKNGKLSRDEWIDIARRSDALASAATTTGKSTVLSNLLSSK